MGDTADAQSGNDTGKPARMTAPLIEVRYEGLSYAIRMTAQQARTDIPTVLGTIVNIFMALPRRVVGKLRSVGAERSPPPEDFRVLADVSGCIRPSTMTLVLAPPGHGKSALLKALTAMLPTSGRVTYSGKTAE